MDEKEIKKKKRTLTITSGKPHNVPNYVQSSHKKSFVVEKKISRKKTDKRFQHRTENNEKFHSKPKFEKSTNFFSRTAATNRNFEIRKKAEERAKKRFKSPEKEETIHTKKNNLTKGKSPASKREYKLTLSKALDDEALEGKGRSLASLKRAKQKENRDIKKEDKQDWYILFQGYADFYQVEINDNITNAVWQWLHTPEHELQGLVGEINNKVIAFFLLDCKCKSR